MTIAFVPVSFGYGTTMRCLAVAQELRRRGHNCVFLGGQPVHHVIDMYGFEVHSIPDVHVRADPRELPAHQLFAQETADDFLDHQLSRIVAVLRETRAALVVFSNSLTAALAAASLDLPSISLFAPSILYIPSVSMVVPMVRTWLHFLALRSRNHLAGSVPSPFLGDRSFIPSFPPLIHWPTLLPPGLAARRYQLEPAGALLTQQPDALPPRGVLRQELGVGGSPFVHATVGGAIFSVDLVRQIADGIRRTHCFGLVSGGSAVSGGVSQELSDDRVRVARFVPDGFRAIKAADVLIWHGGHQTMMEAVACATPAVGLPYQLDQFANVAGLVHLGAGLSLSVQHLRAQKVADALGRILDEPRFQAQMGRLRELNGGYCGVPGVASAAEALLATRGRMVA